MLVDGRIYPFQCFIDVTGLWSIDVVLETRAMQVVGSNLAVDR